MLHFNQDGTAGLDSSFQPLLPILTSNVTYAYSQSTPDGLDPALATSEFISEGRFTPTCQFITFSGPDVGSDYVSELDTIKEAIFLKLQDYIYEIKYTIVGEVFNPPRFYLVDPVLFRAYQAYDICGNSAVLHAKKGRLRLYGFSKYLVLWSPDELQISLKVTAKLQLSPTERSIRNPLVVGKHYVCVNNCPILVYENVYNKETSLLTRVVDPRSRKANKIIRKQYLANYKLGCLPELRVEGESAKNLQLPPPPATTLTIEGGPTITDFKAKYVGLAATGVGRNVGIFCSILYYWLQLDNKGQTPQSPITTTDTLGLNTDIMASYIYINTSGFVRMSISFDINFLQPGDFDCGDGFLSSAPLFALIDYHTGNDVQTYEVKNGNFQPSGRSILYADTSNDQDIKWRGSFILEVTAGQFYWFKTTSVTKNYFGIANAVASSINGSFEIDYLQLL